MSTISDSYRPDNAHRPDEDDLKCPRCHTDQHLIIRSIEALTPPVPGTVQVAYTCSRCGHHHDRPATVPEIAAVLNRPGPQHSSEVLQFGSAYIHCGEPMHAGNTGLRSIYAPMTTEHPSTAQTSEGLLEVYLRTRVLRCGCGFQMEIPA
jgi:hypothetical protein